jgi:hypothetical protein
MDPVAVAQGMLQLMDCNDINDLTHIAFEKECNFHSSISSQCHTCNDTVFLAGLATDYCQGSEILLDCARCVNDRGDGSKGAFSKWYWVCSNLELN